MTPQGALTPESCGTPMLTPELSLSVSIVHAQAAEIERLTQRVDAQRHALRELNKAIRFVLNTLGKPMHVKGTRKPAKKGKL